MNTTSNILYSTKNNCASLTFMKKTLSLELMNDLESFINKINGQDDIDFVLIQGSNEIFSYGGDVLAIHNYIQEPEKNVNYMNDLFHLINTCANLITSSPKIFVAVLEGCIAGGALGLAMTCDCIIAHSFCKFVFGWDKLGVTCDGGFSYVVPRIIGRNKTIEMLLHGDICDSNTFLSMNLINHIFKSEEEKQTLLTEIIQTKNYPKKLTILN